MRDRRGLYHRQAANPNKLNEGTGENLQSENRHATLSVMAAALSEFSQLEISGLSTALCNVYKRTFRTRTHRWRKMISITPKITSLSHNQTLIKPRKRSR